MAFTSNGFNFNQSVLGFPRGGVLNTGPTCSTAQPGFEVNERTNAHNFA